jgi:hypothetical protein
MKLHTSLTEYHVFKALSDMHAAGKITPDVHFVKYKALGSDSHRYGYEIQLGTEDKFSLPTGYLDQRGKKLRVRRYKNSGDHGADSVWAATYHEWGWYIAEIFRKDPHAKWGGGLRAEYPNAKHFHAVTNGKFLLPDRVIPDADGWVTVDAGFPYVDTYKVRAQ